MGIEYNCDFNIITSHENRAKTIRFEVRTEAKEYILAICDLPSENSVTRIFDSFDKAINLMLYLSFKAESMKFDDVAEMINIDYRPSYKID